MARRSIDELLGEAPIETDPPRTSGTGAWAYLAVLAVVSLVVVAAALADRWGGAGPAVAGDAAEPVELVLRVSTASVTLEGRVPAADARDQLVELARARYGGDGTTDMLVLDAGTTLEGGAVRVVGTVAEGDVIPGALQADIAAAFDLRAGPVELAFEPAPVPAPTATTEPPPQPVELVVDLAPDRASVAGTVPDEPVAEQVRAALSGAWAELDAEALLSGGATWEAGRVSVTGTLDAGDTRLAELVRALGAVVPAEVGVDATGVVLDTGPEARRRLQDRLGAELRQDPIRFVGEAIELDPASQPVLAELAAVLQAAPGVPVQLVGHSDPLDDPALHATAAQQRAELVLARLIELGVDPGRLAPAGLGATEPIAPSDTEQGRAANRRVELRFPGASA